MTFQVFLAIFLFFFLQLHLTCALQSKTSEFDLKNFNGVVRKGDNTKIVHELEKHLMYLGYLDPNNLASENYFNQHLKHAIKKYQEFYSLNITGVLDINTITLIRKTRCGVPDCFSPQTNFKSLYAFFPGNPRWWKTMLKYHMTISVIGAHRQPIEQALREWQYVTPFTFSPAEEDDSDIIISFEVGNHGDGFPFSADGPSIAHSFRPPSGRLHFNAEKRWASNKDCNAYDIRTVALHELGHVLGLDHSTLPMAIMYPDILLGETRDIHRDDINGINALYGFM